MLPIFLLVLAIFTALIRYFAKIKIQRNFGELLLSSIIFFNIGIMSLISFIAHVFMADETARSIGWEPGSPFQFEIGMANLSYAIIGLLAPWCRGPFWIATVVAYVVFVLGDFVGHLIQYFAHGDTAPYNIGLPILINDFFLPILLLNLLIWYMITHKNVKE